MKKPSVKRLTDKERLDWLDNRGRTAYGECMFVAFQKDERD